jgi:hypothetical protein
VPLPKFMRGMILDIETIEKRLESIAGDMV